MYCQTTRTKINKENFVKQTLDKSIEISQRITPGWSLLAKRWIVERTFSWLNGYRRLSKDVEITVQSAENMIMIAHIALLAKRLT
mgnify:CR=1 FL=1